MRALLTTSVSSKYIFRDGVVRAREALVRANVRHRHQSLGKGSVPCALLRRWWPKDGDYLPE